MSNLPGNPYMSSGQETLALAYEQRTANLLTFLTWDGQRELSDAECALQSQIVDRLGLREQA